MEGMLVGNWTVERLLGEGGMGKVYLARHRHLNTLAALKVLYISLTHDQSFRDRFLQEAQTQSQLQHPNIARIIDYIERESQYYLVVEYLAGGTLADVIDNAHGPLDMARAVSWTRQALSALNYAHQRGIIHRDIKPSNIMFDDEGNIKVMDFGIALVMGGRRLTSTGVTMGTPEYMSPEQIVRPKDVDHRTDVYSMGIVLYEMLSGRVPFDGDTDFAVRAAQVNAPPPPLRYLNPAIPEALEQLVMRALAKDANLRYSGCGEFIGALDRFSTSGPLVTPEPITPASPQFWQTQPQPRPDSGARPVGPSPQGQPVQPPHNWSIPPAGPPPQPPLQPGYDWRAPRPVWNPAPVAPGLQTVKTTPLILMMLLQFISCGLYQHVWFLARRRSLNFLQSREKLGSGIFIFGIIWWTLFCASYVLGAALGASSSGNYSDTDLRDLYQLVSGIVVLLGLLGLAILVAFIVQSFKVRRILRDHFNGYLGHNIYWSGGMVFFFGFFYLQYKINRLQYQPYSASPIYRAPSDPIHRAPYG
ncbi:MAG: serine/threonine protein kinase [Blastocatellia bacterium]